MAPAQLGKWLVLFCDEINLPDLDKYGKRGGRGRGRERDKTREGQKRREGGGGGRGSEAEKKIEER